ncbi:hypothetical protein [Methanolobus bombayensis]|nr:hypothetical protein [Methanolobus bombayensis]MBP1910002.1 hypothetical protein [Methanolobus bombayensis]
MTPGSLKAKEVNYLEAKDFVASCFFAFSHENNSTGPSRCPNGV